MREFKSAINLLLMVIVHTGIYVVESVCWETIYINNTLWAFFLLQYINKSKFWELWAIDIIKGVYI